MESNPCSDPTYSPNDKYVVGGEEARPHSLPWHVSIHYQEIHICDGTLIDDRHILTSANCLQDNLFVQLYSIVLGAHYLSNATDRVPIDNLTFHRDYNIDTLANNIGLIKLSKRIQPFSDRITPACLARSIRQSNASNPLIVAGWSTMENGTEFVQNTNELRQTILTVMDECSLVYPNYDVKKQICAGREASERDLCQGYLGGGLFEKQTYDIDRWILTGIVNYGCEYASQGYPGVYTSIVAYYDWIQNAIEQMN